MRQILFLALVSICASTCHADVPLGSFDFDSNLFGDSLFESDGGIESAANWLNVVNLDPGNPAYLTGANFDTGIANWEDGLSYTIEYNTPIVNGDGADFGVVVARFNADDFLLAVSSDGDIFSNDVAIDQTLAVDSGEDREYFYAGAVGQSFTADLWVHSLDLNDFAIADGGSIQAIRLTAITNQQIDLVRAAGFSSVPEPGSLGLLGCVFALLATRRRR